MESQCRSDAGVLRVAYVPELTQFVPVSSHNSTNTLTAGGFALKALRVAWVCTFNACVGLALDKTALDLIPVFVHSQLYAELSGEGEVTTSDSIASLIVPPHACSHHSCRT